MSYFNKSELDFPNFAGLSNKFDFKIVQPFDNQGLVVPCRQAGRNG